MPELLNLPVSLDDRKKTHGFFDDFDHLVTADRWTDTSGDTGASVAVGDGAGGLASIVTGATDNNEAYMHTTAELFKFANGKPLVCGVRLQYTEANADDANVAFGLMNAVGADSILDDAGGPKADYSGAVFFKADGDTNWSVEKSLSTTQNTAELTAVNSLDNTAKTAGGSSYQVLEIKVTPTTGNQADFDFFIDGKHVYRMKDESISSATEMELFVGAKAGDANSETVVVDYIYCYQTR